MAPRLYLVRHGQAVWQVERSGDLDSPLTHLGHEQSQALAGWLRLHLESAPGRIVSPGQLFTSPLRRARETCSYIETALGVEAEVLETLREATFRVADQLPSADRPFLDDGAVGDAYAAFRSQAAQALRQLYDAAVATEGPVVAVTHGGLIKTLLRVAAESDRICFDVFNATATILDWCDGRWRLAHLSLSDHLALPLRSI
jgi:probable phosphoglycerate mutase